jgi:ubiquinone/menaquinone biosynthesis C-methylase UbiE
MGKSVASVHGLSPDGSGRFLMISKLLETLHEDKGREVSLLDVGGSSDFMSAQLRSLPVAYNLTMIDILPKPDNFTGNYVRGDATNMPFNDGEFDTVISTDVLEHIPQEKKETFIQECLRVAKSFIIIAAPFDTSGVEEAEKATNNFNKLLFRRGQPWLEEHFENGKPNLDTVKSIVVKAGYESVIVGNNNLYNWLFATHANLIEAKLGLNQQKHIQINKKLSEGLLKSGDMTGPFYRHFVIIFKKKASPKLLEKIRKVKTPDEIEYSSSINYIHNLMKLIVQRIQASDVQLEGSSMTIDELQQKLKEANHTIAQQELIIEQCKPYLSLLKLHPRNITKKRTRDISKNG